MDIEQAVKGYSAPQHASDLIEKTRITLLVGISGAGKDTIKKDLLRRSDYMDIVSHTTRPIRTNNGVQEQADVDYHFIDDATAASMLQNHEFIEAKFVHGTIYGTSIAELQAAYDTDKIAVTDLDVQGVMEYKNVSNDVIAIFILPPDYTTWVARLATRYSTPEELAKEWPKRRQSAIYELEHALAVPYYHFIINDDLDRAVRVVDEIAHRADSFNRHDDEARLLARDLLSSIIDSE